MTAARKARLDEALTTLIRDTPHLALANPGDMCVDPKANASRTARKP